MLMSHGVDELKWLLESSKESMGYISDIHDACSILAVLLALCPGVPQLQFPTACSTCIFHVHGVYCKCQKLEAENTLVSNPILEAIYAPDEVWGRDCPSIMHLLTRYVMLATYSPSVLPHK